jgi:hypothetical protein
MYIMTLAKQLEILMAFIDDWLQYICPLWLKVLWWKYAAYDFGFLLLCIENGEWSLIVKTFVAKIVGMWVLQYWPGNEDDDD